MDWETLATALKKIYERRDGNLDAFNEEAPSLEIAIPAVLAALTEYELLEPIDRGGAGIVLRLQDRRSSADRALKLPRPRKDDLIESVRNELDHLRRLAHPHLIRIHTGGEVATDLPGRPETLYPYYVMDYVPGAKDIAESLAERIQAATSSRSLEGTIKWLKTKLDAVAEALAYLHRKSTLHFDVKPQNILLTPDGTPVLSDLGFAKTISKSMDKVVVGFTYFYAHPDLSATYQEMSSLNRVRRPMRPTDFKPIWDIYAFGKTILQLLACIDGTYPEAVPYEYGFSYLHLLACRMLDGRNLSDRDTERIVREQRDRGLPRSTYKETWLNLSANELSELKITTFGDVHDALAKLGSDGSMRQTLPELDPLFTGRIQVSGGMPLPFSERVGRIVQHPVVQRLRSVPQLGLMNTVYPGVNHSRLEHSLGAMRICWLYLQALAGDPFNPVFRQIVTSRDMECVLLASLLHDLGQYPLAHELTDILSFVSGTEHDRWAKLLKHENLTPRWLDSSATDQEGKTLGQLIEELWGVQVDDLKQLLKPNAREQGELFNTPLRSTMLRSIVDGPIDVDKLDYLNRDSERAYLPYGRLIDLERLVRSLTIVLKANDKGRAAFLLGTYERGQSAAESVSFARYLLYQALYWHHTARSIRVMLRAALKPCLEERREANRTGKRRKAGFEEHFLAMLGLSSAKPCEVGVEDVLKLVEAHTDPFGKELVGCLRRRRYYKRLLTLHDDSTSIGGAESRLSRFRNAITRPGFEGRLQKEVAGKFLAFRNATTDPRVSVLAPEKLDKTTALLETPGGILCDAPHPSLGTEQTLRFMPEPKRLLRNYESRVDVGERVSEVWQQVHYRLMGIAAKGRVFCHPELRDSLMFALGPEGLSEAVEEVLKD